MEREVKDMRTTLKKSVIYRMLRWCKRTVTNMFADIKTVPYFYRIKKQGTTIKDRKIRVAFLGQYVPAWNKFESIYNLMKNDNRFETYIVCLPSDIQNNIYHYDGRDYNDTYEYFYNNGYTDCINAIVGEGQWYNLEDFDYIFYTRPYNSVLPIVYTTDYVKKYAKICSVMYGMSMTEDVLYQTVNIPFYKDVYIYFAETKYALKAYKKKFRITTKLGLKKVFFYGYPVLEQILKDADKQGDSWGFSKNTFRVMWTPRWTTALNLGGSNFFMYYKSLIRFATEHQDIDFLLRPHPLTFDNFVKTGEMTQKEVAEYKQAIADMTNMSLDTEKEYNATIWNSDAVIADISGFLPEYFITGKPIIYCASNMILTPAEHTKILMQGCYVSYNEEQTYEYLLMLKNGKDPLKDKRKEIIKELFGENLNCATERIVEEIFELSV